MPKPSVLPRTANAEERIFAVLASIEKTVADNNGTYPFTHSGKLTIAAFLRLTGLNPSYLEKRDRPHIAALKERIILELARIGVLSPRHRAVVIPGPISRKGSNLDRSETIAVMQAYAEAELHHQATLKELDVARTRIAELEAQILSLQHQVANVIPINRARP